MAADVATDEWVKIRTGPVHKNIPFRDFYLLPGTARDRSEIWAYAKRFYRRLGDLTEQAKRGRYDPAVVAAMSEEGERPSEAMETRVGVTVDNRLGRLAEKELWECLALADFDGLGERWYLATLHPRSRSLLRLQHDDLGAQRLTLLVLFPRPDSVYGYSLVGDKLLTVIEEHTAWRNMLADRASLSLMAPILRKTGALWDPDEQPIGPKAVIDVREMTEIQALQFPDVTTGALDREREVKDAAQRLTGITESSLGIQPEATRTLGEVQLVAQQSFGRMQIVLHRVYEALEDLFQIRHQIWQRVLAEEAEPLILPPSRLLTLESRGMTLMDGQITAEMLTGTFRGKPRGSVESANPNQARLDFNQFLQLLPGLLQMWPALATQLQTPQAARAILEEAIRVHRFQNREALLRSTEQAEDRMNGESMGAGDGSQITEVLARLTGQMPSPLTQRESPPLSSPMAAPLE